jgi:hypothetical protein
MLLARSGSHCKTQAAPDLAVRETVKQHAEKELSLSPHRAFVVQFRAETDVAEGRVAGRVEHVVSGQATHFASLDELLTFIARVLAKVRAPPRGRPRGRR